MSAGRSTPTPGCPRSGRRRNNRKPLSFNEIILLLSAVGSFAMHQFAGKRFRCGKIQDGFGARQLWPGIKLSNRHQIVQNERRASRVIVNEAATPSRLFR
jgi:hypothetical protein